VGGTDINARLAQARELEAKLAEKYHAVRLMRTTTAGEAPTHGERVRELGRQAASASTPTSTSTTRTRHRARARS
jgi:hypothetical protein